MPSQREKTVELFAELRSYSTSPGAEIECGSSILETNARRQRKMRKPLIAIIAGAAQQIAQWRQLSPHSGGLYQVDAHSTVKPFGPVELIRRFKVTPISFFWNCGELTRQTWDAAVVVAAQKPELAEAFEQVAKAEEEIGGSRGILFVPSRFPGERMPTSPRQGLAWWLLQAMKYNVTVNETGNAARRWLATELTPAVSIIAGFLHLAWLRTVETDRIRRILANSRYLLESWANLAPGYFVSVRAGLLCEGHPLLDPTAFALENNGQANETLTITDAAIARIRSFAAHQVHGVTYRFGCPALAARGDANENPLGSSFEWMTELYSAHGSYMRRH